MNDDKQLHPDYLDARALLMRAKVVAIMAESFCESHLQHGLTFKDMAARLKVPTKSILKMMELSRVKDRTGLAELSDIAVALDCEWAFSAVDLHQQTFENGDGI